MAQEKVDPLALQILLDELDILEDQQKGKQKESHDTDLEISIQSMKDDIMAIQTSLQDEIMALSTSVAVAMDQDVLASMREEERLAEQDRRYAAALSNGEETENATPTYEPTETDKNDDVVSAVMSDLMSRITIRDDQSNGEGSSRSHLPYQTAAGITECGSCLERFHDPGFTSACGHEFCLNCVRQMFLGAIKDEELYPPRCCGHVVPPGIALRVLQYGELSAFGERAIEWTAKDRLYCADPTCSKFIPPFAITDEIGTCPSCDKQTHLTCRSFAHPETDCPLDDVLHDVLKMAEEESWKRCFHCRTMVELHRGCNHITCRSVTIYVKSQ
ncbi:hypothetical protein N7488_005057 [Penicillium malachiteum]|nr:hypothetical protein N7488_005057 [Penicillium malachiteum]